MKKRKKIRNFVVTRIFVITISVIRSNEKRRKRKNLVIRHNSSCNEQKEEKN